MPATLALYVPTAGALRAMPSCPDGEHWAILDVTGIRATLRMFLPTGPLASMEGAYWTDWIVAMHGRQLARTGASPTQRDALLDIVYAFNIFTDGHANVDPDHYPVFVAKIVEIATSEPPFEPVDLGLEEISALARRLIPQSVWNIYVLPPPPDYPAELLGFPSPDDSDEWVRAYLRTWREARRRLFHTPAHSIASAERALLFAPPPPISSTMPPPSPGHPSSSASVDSDGDSIPPLESCPASESEDEGSDSSDGVGSVHASLPPSRDAINPGYESDDSIPSLRTVDDSSDSDFEDGRAERARELRDFVDRFLVASDVL